MTWNPQVFGVASPKMAKTPITEKALPLGSLERALTELARR